MTIRNFPNFVRARHFALILAICRYDTMHSAASALGMTQSTASKMLSDLEALLGAQLFNREPRGMSPTALGRFAADKAQDILGRIDRFVQEFEILRDGGHGMLVIGAIMGSAPDLVAGTVAEIKERHPFLTVRLMGETSDNILDMLETSEIDLAVGRFSTSRHALLFSFEPLAEEPLVLVTRAGHPLAKETGVQDLSTLGDWPWVLQPRSVPARQLLDRAFLEAGIEGPRNHVESVSIFAILHLVQSSNSIALLPLSVVRDHLNTGLMTQLTSGLNLLVPDFGLLTRRGESLSNTATLFAEILRKNAASSTDTDTEAMV
ncbi:MAG: DNA-binding transcriptional LysR family regulator [Candidatus Azotimanducaceae bacterium]|jgi:DNA-binding transcriptional LysR family regulator